MKENKRVMPNQWKRALPHMFVWIDICCVPQPAGGPLVTSLMPKEIARSGFSAILKATMVEMEVASPRTPVKLRGPTHPFGQKLKFEMRSKLRQWDTDIAFRQSHAEIYDSRAHYEMHLVSQNALAVQSHLASVTATKQENESSAIVHKKTLEYGRDHTTYTYSTVDSDDDSDSDGDDSDADVPGIIENDNEIAEQKDGYKHQRPSKLETTGSLLAKTKTRRTLSTSDHRHTQMACPPWLTHAKVKFYCNYSTSEYSDLCSASYSNDAPCTH